ncbi:hypothetical protein QQ008_08030 [Fulvivirgaceae bacterium BMA10]|uniref:Uncharacterized protein n=1 Tax=Splendidivirga corallicola TaxID=3051826 RepID=A0ABT8KKQ9_9BACT|nr:hypothetical protein [Fulvivirgaceae bacterium BMA10]
MISRQLPRLGFIVCLFLGTLFIHAESKAQVGKVEQKTRENKSQKSGSSNSSSSGDSGDTGDSFFGTLFIDVFFGGFNLMFDAHRSMLDRRFHEPWMVSMEGNLTGGYDPNFSTFMLSSSLRGNWGLFSTQFRFNRLFDNTGTFRTFDWQIIQFNILAREEVNFWIGTGLSHEFTADQTYHENSVGLKLFFNQRKINPGIEFRWSRDYETGATPRIELNTQLDYLIGQYGKIDLNLMGGFSYQRYFSDVDFYFLQTGLIIRLN